MTQLNNLAQAAERALPWLAGTDLARRHRWATWWIKQGGCPDLLKAILGLRWVEVQGRTRSSNLQIFRPWSFAVWSIQGAQCPHAQHAKIFGFRCHRRLPKLRPSGGWGRGGRGGWGRRRARDLGCGGAGGWRLSASLSGAVGSRITMNDWEEV